MRNFNWVESGGVESSVGLSQKDSGLGSVG